MDVDKEMIRENTKCTSLTVQEDERNSRNGPGRLFFVLFGFGGFQILKTKARVCSRDGRSCQALVSL